MEPASKGKKIHLVNIDRKYVKHEAFPAKFLLDSH